MRILWVKTSPLHPLTRGGDLRTFHLLRALHERHEITFAGMTADATQQGGAALSSRYSTRAFWTHLKKASQKPGRLRFAAGAALNLLSSLPYAVERFSSRRWTRQLAHILQHHAFDVVVCDFLFPAASLPWDQKLPSQPWVLFQHNVESVIWERRAAKLSGVSKSYFTAQWRRMRDFEQRMSGRFDSVLTVSEEDAATCLSLYQLTNVRGHVPTGVDLDYFTACPRQLAADPTVVFLGSMDWYANADAVRQFAAEIWPRVIGRMPQARLLVVGRNPPQDLRDLASSGRNIEITGTVADVRPHLRSAHAMVVPLRIGGGTRLKIFEALAAEVPVVSTHVGAEGLALENGRHILLADQPAEFAEAVLQLLGNPDKGRQIAACARTEVAEKNSWRSAAAVLEKHLEQVIDGYSS